MLIDDPFCTYTSLIISKTINLYFVTSYPRSRKNARCVYGIIRILLKLPVAIRNLYGSCLNIAIVLIATLCKNDHIICEVLLLYRKCCLSSLFPRWALKDGISQICSRICRRRRRCTVRSCSCSCVVDTSGSNSRREAAVAYYFACCSFSAIVSLA